MCPGGLIVPAATAPGEIVVNGMSMSRRDSPFANSGTVVAVEPEDWKRSGYDGVFGALEFQAHVEHAAFASNESGSQQAPAPARIASGMLPRIRNAATVTRKPAAAILR